MSLDPLAQSEMPVRSLLPYTHPQILMSASCLSDYSQCLPGVAAPGSGGGSSGGSSLPFLGGVNTAGFDFGVVRHPSHSEVKRKLYN